MLRLKDLKILIDNQELQVTSELLEKFTFKALCNYKQKLYDNGLWECLTLNSKIEFNQILQKKNEDTIWSI